MFVTFDMHFTLLVEASFSSINLTPFTLQFTEIQKSLPSLLLSRSDNNGTSSTEGHNYCWRALYFKFTRTRCLQGPEFNISLSFPSFVDIFLLEHSFDGFDSPYCYYRRQRRRLLRLIAWRKLARLFWK